MKNKVPPPKFGKIVDGKYSWYHQKPLPKWYNSGNTIFPQYLPHNQIGVHDFYSGDNEKEFQKNLQTMESDWHYRTKKVEYTLNSLGYRTQEFENVDWKNSILLFGCSCTFGVGVSDDETLSHYIKEMTGKEVINLGVPGGSNQFFLDLAITIKRNYGSPYGVISMWTVTDRFPYYGNKQVYHVGIWNTIPSFDNDPKKFESMFLNAYEDLPNEMIPFRNIVFTMREIWGSETKYTEASFFEPSAHYGELPDFIPFSNTGRDLIHPGPTDHKRAAEILVKQLKEKYGEDSL